MDVYQEGLIFRAAKTTGPTHNFLAIELNEISSFQGVFDFKSRAPAPTEKFQNKIDSAIDNVKHLFPVGGKYYLRNVFVNSDDSPSEKIYTDMLEEIIRCVTLKIE